MTGTAWSARTLRDVLLKPAIAGLAIRDGAVLPGPAPWPADLGTRRVAARQADRADRDLHAVERAAVHRPKTHQPRRGRTSPAGWSAGSLPAGCARAAPRAGVAGTGQPPTSAKECCHVRRNAAPRSMITSPNW